LTRLLGVSIHENEYALRQLRWRENSRSSEEDRMPAKKKAKKKR
jgi:hypothetical protein